MTLLLLLLVGPLACARATRLVVDDTILDGPRDRLVPRLPRSLRKLVICPWCISAYITGAVVIWYWVTQTLPMPLLIWGYLWWGCCAAYWLVELLAHENEPDADDVIADFWKQRENRADELPPRPPLPRHK